MTDQEFLQQIRRCNRCGFCQNICPTYYYTKNEGLLARGRIRLIRTIHENNQSWGNDPELDHLLRSCLLCKACVVNCPSTVPTDELVIKAREKLNRANGFKFLHKALYRGVLSQRQRLPKIMSLARFYNKSGVRWLVKNIRLTSLFENLGRLESYIPVHLPKSARSQLPQLLEKVEKPRYRVGYFLGCATDNFFSDIAKATILYLQHVGCEVVVPPAQCCGGPHYSAGDLKEATRLARANVEYLIQEDCDYIVSDCATCTATLKEYARFFGPEEQEQVQAFTAKVLDLNQFIVHYLPLPELKPLQKRVTFHDPCHLVRGLGIKAEPRQILQSIPGVTFVEMKQADWCCGGAGSYFLTQAQMSKQILQGKIDNFVETGAEVLATACPSCTLQLSAGLQQRGLKAQVRHPVQLLAASAGIMESALGGKKPHVPLPHHG